ncbi:24011_t:CDS:2 [Dentiscutata erythropus]|uniref:24011_t:CDS:1 n=1 Tax=Dentiscutata erythropus TaxID=1348616 RepID=A0A9N9E965_9GLOM|nr:24011_t:CDS:2 [Dentiscutata erythropus]
MLKKNHYIELEKLSNLKENKNRDDQGSNFTNQQIPKFLTKFICGLSTSEFTLCEFVIIYTRPLNNKIGLGGNGEFSSALTKITLEGIVLLVLK